MAPNCKKKQTKTAQDSAKIEELKASKERIMKIKRDTVKLVEMMIEKGISNDWFVQNCGLLCQDDYQDVVQERSIEHLCGYPLCDKQLGKVLKQQYHISKATNKVYDLTERKCYCSNECYKASNFINAQLPQLPLYMRKNDKPVKIDIIQDSHNRGSAGEEIKFDLPVSKDEIDLLDTEPIVPSDHLINILQRDLTDCEEQLSKLEITEKVYEEPYIFCNDTKTEEHCKKDEKTESSDQEESDDDEEESKLFPDYDNINVLSNKHMPLPNQTKKAVLISPLKATAMAKPQPAELSIEYFQEVFNDWFTEDTMKYFLGEKEFYSAKADLLFKTMTDDSSSAEKVESAKSDYIDLCLKIDKLQSKELSDCDEFDIGCPLESTGGTSSKSRDCFVIETKLKPIPRKPFRRQSKEKDRIKTKSVKFAPLPKAKEKTPIAKVPQSDTREAEEELPEPTFPLIDSTSQNTLQRQVLLSKLKSVYYNILPVVDLHYKNIREGVRKIVETYSLTPSNIIFKPKELRVIAIILFRILSRTTFQEFESIDIGRLCHETISTLNISAEDVDTLVSNLVSKKQLQKLQVSLNSS